MELLPYLIRSGIYAAIMLAVYYALWRRSPHVLYSRIYLLAALVLPAVLPLIHITVQQSSPAAVYYAALPGFSVMSGGSNTAGLQAKWSWQDMVIAIYFSVCMLLGLFYALLYLRIIRKLQKGQKQQQAYYTLITHTGIGPGTLGRQVFFPDGVINDTVIRHEQAHISLGHRFDALLIQLTHIFFWLSPAHWLICRELKMVHEFEADRIASVGMDPADYTALLLARHLGVSMPIDITQSFFHQPLKHRVMMLQKIKTGKPVVPVLFTIALTTAFTTTVLFAQTKRTQESNKPATQAKKDPVDAWMKLPKPGEVTLAGDGSIVFKAVEKMPAFKGDMWQWLAQHVQYPEAARADKLFGGTVVRFTVSEDGSIVNPSVLESSGHQVLDKEALRVIGAMPAWNPGLQHGKPVAVSYTLPVFFNKDGNVRGGC